MGERLSHCFQMGAHTLFPPDSSVENVMFRSAPTLSMRTIHSDGNCGVGFARTTSGLRQRWRVQALQVCVVRAVRIHVWVGRWSVEVVLSADVGSPVRQRPCLLGLLLLCNAFAVDNTEGSGVRPGP